jgi:hypothetical protein
MKTELGMGLRSAACASAAWSQGGGRHGAALRIETGGRWRTWVWSQVEHLTAALLPSDEDEEEDEDAPPWRPGWASAAALGAGDEVLVLGDVAVPRAWALAWMNQRFVFNLSEEGRLSADLRDVRPHVVMASGPVLDRWADHAASAVTRRRGFGRGAHDPGLLERLAWWRWRAQVGLARTRAFVCTEGTPAARTVRLFERGGLAVHVEPRCHATIDRPRASDTAEERPYQELERGGRSTSSATAW